MLSGAMMFRFVRTRKLVPGLLAVAGAGSAAWHYVCIRRAEPRANSPTPHLLFARRLPTPQEKLLESEE